MNNIYKSLILSIVFLFCLIKTYAQTSEAEAINTIKKTKCLSLMTNCEARQDYFQAASQYWQCYVQNNDGQGDCKGIHPLGKLPDCPEDDLNFPTEQSTKYFMDKCISRYEVVVIRKKSVSNNENTGFESSPVEDDVIMASLSQKRKSRPQKTEEENTESTASTSDESRANIGYYILSGVAILSGNVSNSIQISEKEVDENGTKRFAISSMGKEVLVTKRKKGESSFSAAWNYSEPNPGQGDAYLTIARSCKISISPDERTVTISMQNVKTKPEGGGFFNSVGKGLMMATSLASAYVAEESLSGLKLSADVKSSISSLGSMATEEFKKPTKWKIVTANKETKYVFEKTN